MSDYRKYKVGLKPKGVGPLDYKHVCSLSTETIIPNIFSLRDKIPFIYDQEQFESCVSNATSLYLAYLNNTFTPSRLFIYYNGRAIENDVTQDHGLYIVTGCTSVKKNTPCDEALWKYNNINLLSKPTDNCYTKPINLVNFKYFNVEQNIESIKKCIYEGFPIMIGITVFSNFYNTGKNGVVSLPTSKDKNEGGHCVLIVGYDDTKKVFTLANSWGVFWGDSGYFTLPYEFIMNTDYSYDFYSINIDNKNIVTKSIVKSVDTTCYPIYEVSGVDKKCVLS
jgi:hypothetical protein